jgi:hypothetical protein
MQRQRHNPNDTENDWFLQPSRLMRHQCLILYPVQLSHLEVKQNCARVVVEKPHSCPQVPKVKG